MRTGLRSRSVRYRRADPLPGGLGVVDGWIVAADVERLPLAGGGPASVGPDGRIMPIAELGVPGAHNVSNALAAVAVGLLFGIEPFGDPGSGRGVPRRGAPTRDRGRWSMACASSTTRRGRSRTPSSPRLRAFDGPIVLIAGGRDKGVDLTDLGPVVAERAVAAVLIGESGPDLEARFREAGLAQTVGAATLEDAVRLADDLVRAAMSAQGTRPGVGTVLLSPAAASFDMFTDYAARGAAFKAAVAGLAATHAQGRDR